MLLYLSGRRAVRRGEDHRVAGRSGPAGRGQARDVAPRSARAGASSAAAFAACLVALRLARLLTRLVLRRSDSLPSVSTLAISRPPSMLAFLKKWICWLVLRGRVALLPEPVTGERRRHDRAGQRQGGQPREPVQRQQRAAHHLHRGVHPYRLLGGRDVAACPCRACGRCRASRRSAPWPRGGAARRCLPG